MTAVQQPKPWLDQYPPGVPEFIDKDEFQSIVDILDQSVETFGDRPAFHNFGKTISYGELDELSDAFGSYLQHKCKLQSGDRVAIMLPNVLQFPIAIFGALKAGLVVVNTNPQYTARELKHQLNDSGAKAVVVLENMAATLQKVLPETEVEHVFITGIGDLLSFPKSLLTNFVLRHVKKMVPDFKIPHGIRFTTALNEGNSLDKPSAVLNHESLAFLQYTGGTTGVAKGAMLTHGNLVANMQQASAWLKSVAKPGEELIITALPLYHIFALTANCLVFIKFGGLNWLITDPRNMKTFVQELEKANPTAITGVNTLFNGLLNAEGFADLEFPRLRLTLGGGMAVQRSVAERWKETTGVTLVEAYGLTETSPAACMNPLDIKEFNGCIGLPIPSTDARIRDQDGNDLPPDETGELCLSGPQIMKGYWNREEETRKVMMDDGFLRTGDMGLMRPDGYFKLVDRKKDMILVSGFNVYPNEIEDVLAGHPKVLEAGAIGMPSESSGEVVKVVVVKKDESLTESEVIAHCREHLTGYKVPKIVEFRDELPKTNVGKILRRKLRDD